MEKRETFASRLGFLLISAGCAIGLGNVWRFPRGVRFYVSYALPAIVLFIFVMGYWNQFGAMLFT